MRIAFKYAVIGTSLSILWKLLVFNLGWEDSKFGRISGFMPLLILLLCVFYGIKTSRKSLKDITSDTFKQNMKTGMRISALFALMMGAFIYAYYSWIDPAFFDAKIDRTLTLMKEQGAGREDMEQYFINARMLFTPGKQAFFVFFINMLIGILYSVFTSLFYNRKALK